MSTVNRDNCQSHGRCSSCDEDLIIRPETAKCYCTNRRCKYHRKAHPTGAATNSGRYEEQMA